MNLCILQWNHKCIIVQTNLLQKVREPELKGKHRIRYSSVNGPCGLRLAVTRGKLSSTADSARLWFNEYSSLGRRRGRERGGRPGLWQHFEVWSCREDLPVWCALLHVTSKSTFLHLKIRCRIQTTAYGVVHCLRLFWLLWFYTAAFKGHSLKCCTMLLVIKVRSHRGYQLLSGNSRYLYIYWQIKEY